jgi:hypothetical protein
MTASAPRRSHASPFVLAEATSAAREAVIRWVGRRCALHGLDAQYGAVTTLEGIVADRVGRAVVLGEIAVTAVALSRHVRMFAAGAPFPRRLFDAAREAR